MNNEIMEILHDKIEDIFVTMQGKYGIVAGDIDPTDAYRLDVLEKGLADHIAKVLEYELEVKNDKTKS